MERLYRIQSASGLCDDDCKQLNVAIRDGLLIRFGYFLVNLGETKLTENALNFSFTNYRI